jgi:hypothetical protein
MRPQQTVEDLLVSFAKSLNMLTIGVPGRLAGGRIVAAFREAGAVSRSSAQRYHPTSENDEAAFRGLLAAEIIRQPEPGRYFLDKAALDQWVGFHDSR